MSLNMRKLLFLQPKRTFLLRHSELHSCPLRLKSGVRELRPSYANPRLIASPLVSLLDAKTSIRVEGLEPSRPITLKAEMVEDRGKRLHSNGHFIADPKGVVDTAASESIGGSYTGVFPSGLFSVLKVTSGNFEYGRIHKTIITEPSKITISLIDGHTALDDQNPVLDSTQLERHLMGDGVQRIPVKDGRVRGVLYIPKGEGPFPGVIDMFGATGVLNETRAALNASRGIASLALAYFNYDDIPAEKIRNLDLDYFEEATEFLLSNPMVNSKKCGVVGNCAGGFVAYMMGLHIEKVKAVYLINAPVNSFLGDITYKGKVIAEGANLTEDNFYILEDGSVSPKQEFNKVVTRVPQSFIDKMLNRKDVQYSVAVGDGDPYEFHLGWNSIARQMAENKFHNFEVKVIPKAGHVIYPPYSPFSSTVYARLWHEERGLDGFLLQFGGEPFASVEMQEKTWRDMFSFLRLHLG